MMKKNFFRHECGIVGIYSFEKTKKLAEALFYATFALQHRGQEASGFVIYDGENVFHHKNLGLVEKVFLEGKIFEHSGLVGLSHVRYSTKGRKGNPVSAQPFLFFRGDSPCAIAHNGNLTNNDFLKKYLSQKGVAFVSDSDSEVILHLYLVQDGSIQEKLQFLCQMARGAYSLIIMDDENLIGMRDPYGFRPLILGEMKNGFIIASETCALNFIDGNYIREIQPGEAVVINKEGIRSFELLNLEFSKLRRCIFELIYFSRPDSTVFGEHVYSFRKRTGYILGRRENEDIDVVIPVPDSGLPSAIGYMEGSGKPLELGLIRSHYLGRSFIEPTPEYRELAVKLKLLPQTEVLRNKKVALIDDSLVRGTTMREIVKRLRKFGAEEVHVRIASPPIIGPCFYGIDIPTKKDLVASGRSIDEIREFIGANSLRYLSIEELIEATDSKGGFCLACFNLDYLEEFLEDEKYSCLGFRERKQF